MKLNVLIGNEEAVRYSGTREEVEEEQNMPLKSRERLRRKQAFDFKMAHGQTPKSSFSYATWDTWDLDKAFI